MAHGVSAVLRKNTEKGAIGSRRIFAPHFKLQVLDSYRNDADCKGNQRATARKYGIHRRQIQKWLQVETNLRSTVCKTQQPQQQAPRADSPPLDLRVKKSRSESAAPVTHVPVPAQSPPSLAAPQQHPDVWDLSTKRPVKLFKPYLEDFGVAKQPPLNYCCDYSYPMNNNNNDTYTLHELQPPYYYPYAPYQPSEYEVSPPGGYYEDSFKQRHSYSLDFKLSAIECYYQDSMCKGNQRAVANKYNIHRRQVQKWLKQAEELRQKHDNTQVVS